MVDEEVKSKLEAELRKRVKRGSPVVWFDPYQQFVDYADELDLPGELMKLGDSALKLRHELESQDPDFEENWIIYVPRKREDADWLREYWLIGLTYEDVAEDVLKDIGYLVTHEERKRLRKRDGNKIVNKPHAALESKGGNNPEKADQFRIERALNLDSFTHEHAALELIKNPEDTSEELEESKLVEDFITSISSHYGFNNVEDISEFREELIDAAFLGELADKSDLDLSSYSNILPDEDSWSNCSQLINTWQNNINNQEIFKEEEKEFRGRYPGIEDLLSLDISADKIWDVTGIKAIDEILIKKTDELVAENNHEEASEIIGKRKNIFWSLKHTNSHGSDWRYLELSNELIIKIQELDVGSDLQSIIDNYANSNWEIDRLYRKTSEIIDNVDYISKTPSNISYEYKNYLRALNDSFSGDFESDTSNLDHQIGALDSVEEGSVVFVLDALRYELAYDFDNIQEIQSLFSTLPSKTNIGMAGMLPDIDKIGIEGDEDGLHVNINGSSIESKSDRISYLEDHGWEIYSNLEKLNSNEIEEIAEKAKSGNKVLIYSQSIDLLGENLEDVSLSIFNTLIGKTQKKAENILSHGVDRIIITTDHGFLYKPKENKSETLEKPEGNLIGYGPRYSYGTNLNPGNNTKINISKLGIETDLDFVFPASLGVFSSRGRGKKFLHQGSSVQETVIPWVILSDDSRTSGRLKVSISDAPDEVGSPQFQIELKGTRSKLGEKVVRIEATQHGNKITKDDVYSSIGSGTSTAIINLNTSSIENQTGKIKLEVFNDETNVRLDSKEIDINLLYGGDGL